MSPLPREPIDPASRPLPAAVTIVVAGLTAGLVIGVGVLLAERLEPRRGAAPLAATPLPSLALPAEESARAAAAPIVSAATIVSATPIVSAATIASAAPIVSAATIASAAPIASAPPIAAAAELGEAAGLPPDRGYLVLVGAAEARAYVNGAEVGPSDQRIAVPCGARYVRLGTPAEKGQKTSWVTPGRSVVVACRGETRIDLGR
jgi:hypothetical protein